MGEIRFVGTGETRGYPYLVCKKSIYSSEITSDFQISLVYFIYIKGFYLLRHSQKSRSILQDRSRSLRLFWKGKSIYITKEIRYLQQSFHIFQIHCRGTIQT